MIPEVEWWDILIRLLVAAALTGAIGLERELRDRAAGLRTHMLVGVGSALFTIVSAYGWSDFQFSTAEGVVFDPTRIAAQIVTGIGFLGAGAIIRRGVPVRGLTTAAGLWVVAAIGMAVGAGYYSAALIATGIVLVGLGPFRRIGGGTALARFRRAGRSLESRPDARAFDQRAARGRGRTACSDQPRRVRGPEGPPPPAHRLDAPLGDAEAAGRGPRRARGRRRRAVVRVEGDARLQEPPQGRRSWRCSCPAGQSSRSTSPSSRRRPARPSTRTLARRPPSAARSTAGRRGRSARTRASGSTASRGGPGSGRRATRALEATDEENVAARGARGVAGPGRKALYVSELVCLSPTREEFRGSGTLEGRIGGERRGSGGLRLRPPSSSRTGRSGQSPARRRPGRRGEATGPRRQPRC